MEKILPHELDQNPNDRVRQTLEARYAANPDTYYADVVNLYVFGTHEPTSDGVKYADEANRTIACAVIDGLSLSQDIIVDGSDVALAQQAFGAVQDDGIKWEIVAHDFRSGRIPVLGPDVMRELAERQPLIEAANDYRQLIRMQIAKFDIALSNNEEDRQLQAAVKTILDTLAYMPDDTLLFHNEDAIIKKKFDNVLERACELERTAPLEDVLQKRIPKYLELHNARVGSLSKATLRHHKMLVKSHTIHEHSNAVMSIAKPPFARRQFAVITSFEPASFFRAYRPSEYMKDYESHEQYPFFDHYPPDLELFLQHNKLGQARDMYQQIVRKHPSDRTPDLYSDGDVALQAALLMAKYDTQEQGHNAEVISTIEGHLQLAESSNQSTQSVYGFSVVETSTTNQVLGSLLEASTLLGNLPLTALRQQYAMRIQNALDGLPAKDQKLARSIRQQLTQNNFSTKLRDI